MRSIETFNLTAISLIGMMLFVGCAKKPPAPESLLGKWRTEADGHQLIIDFKSNGIFYGEMGDEKKPLVSMRSLQLPLLTTPKRWGLNGRDLDFEFLGGVKVISVTADTLILLVGGHEYLFQKIETKPEPDNTRVSPHDIAQPAPSDEHAEIIALADDFARKKHPRLSLRFSKIMETGEHWLIWYDIVELKDGRMTVGQQCPSDQLIMVAKKTRDCEWVYGE